MGMPGGCLSTGSTDFNSHPRRIRFRFLSLVQRAMRHSADGFRMVRRRTEDKLGYVPSLSKEVLMSILLQNQQLWFYLHSVAQAY